MNRTNFGPKHEGLSKIREELAQLVKEGSRMPNAQRLLLLVKSFAKAVRPFSRKEYLNSAEKLAEAMFLAIEDALGAHQGHESKAGVK